MSVHLETIYWDKILSRLSKDTKELFDFYELKSLRKSDKQKSEDISGLLETAIADIVPGAIAPKVDSEPDIRLNGEPIEIKTSSGETWRGGTFSKRGGHFIFVNWTLDVDNNPSFFMAGIDLIESDWKKSQSDSYYATTYGKKELYENKDNVIFYNGTLDSYFRGSQLCLKIKYNKVQ